MATRSVSKRTRFEVFKRDGFRCVYCGATPVQRPLHCDHVVAVANGGGNGASNLVTSCDDCNLGKSAVPLARKKLQAVATKPQKDHAAQILKFLELQREIEAAQSKVVESLADEWESKIGPLSQNMYVRIGTLLKTVDIQQLRLALQITAGKFGNPGAVFESSVATKQAKYFHGILRNWRENGVQLQ